MTVIVGGRSTRPCFICLARMKQPLDAAVIVITAAVNVLKNEAKLAARG